MKNWRIELTAGGRKRLVEGKILRSIFQGGPLLPLLFVMAMMPLNYIFRKYTEGYKHQKSQEKINHLYIHRNTFFMDHLLVIFLIISDHTERHTHTNTKTFPDTYKQRRVCVCTQTSRHVQNATQGQPFSKISWFELRVFFLIDQLPYQG